MRGDEDALAGEHLGPDLVLEVGPRAGNRVLQALGVGELVGRDVSILLLGVRVALVARLERGRADIEGAAPDEDLFVAVLGGGVGLVESLQGAVVALVELPGLDDGQPLAIHLGEHEVQGVDGALEARGVADVEVEAGVPEGPPACRGLLPAGLGELDVGPAGKEVEPVPLRLSVADEHELHCFLCQGLCHVIPPLWWDTLAHPGSSTPQDYPFSP